MNKLTSELTTLTDGLDNGISNLPAVVRRNIKKDGALAVQRTVAANMREQGRAMLANTALENAGSLSALEDHLCEISPYGSDRYKAIVDAYTLGACQDIARW
jgi:hypothetical protein